MCCVFLLMVLLPATATSATIYVPDDDATIRDAISAVSNNDTIVLRPGKYVEWIDYTGKAITILSERGPHVTFIDGGATEPVVTFRSQEGPDSILDGFTITNNFIYNNLANDGGGFACWQGSPILNNNTIVENIAYNDGGGIWFMDDCFPTVINSILRDNSSVEGPEIWMGILLDPVVLTISDCDLEGGQGAGVQNPPHITPYGDLHIPLPPLWQNDLGTITTQGILIQTVTLPVFWQAGDQFPLQSLIGPLGSSGTKLTNLRVLTVE